MKCIRFLEPRLLGMFSRNTTFMTFRICGLIMMITSLIVTGFFMLKKAPIVVQKTWKDFRSEIASKSIVVKLIILIKKSIQTVFKLVFTFEILYFILYGIFATLGYSETYGH